MAYNWTTASVLPDPQHSPRWIHWALGSLLVLSTLLHLEPTLRNPLWGSDTGEYSTLSRALQAEASLPQDHVGYGPSYPEFPGMYIFATAAAELLDLPLETTLKIGVPLLGTIALALIYLVTTALSRRPLAGLLACGFLLVSPAHLFGASHAMPASLGEVLMLGAMMVVLVPGRSRACLALVLVLGVGTLATHHLTFGVLVLALIGAYLTEPEGRRSRQSLIALAVLLFSSVAYIRLLAPAFLSETLGPQLGGVTAIAGSGLLILLLVVVLRRRRSAQDQKPALTRTQIFTRMGVMAGLVAAVVAWLLTAGIPGTSIQPLHPIAILYLLPFFLFVIAAPLGPRYMGRAFGNQILGWLSVLVALLLLTLGLPLVGIQLAPPFRAMHYLFKPLAMMTGVGLVFLVEQMGGLRGPLTVAAVVSLLLSPTLAYPPMNLMGGFQEGTTTEELALVAALWFLDGDRVLADHRISSAVYGGPGLDPTWDHGAGILQDDPEGWRLATCPLPGPNLLRACDYIVLSEEYRASVGGLPWVEATGMTEAGFTAWQTGPVRELCSNGEGALYAVSWTGPARKPLVLT